MLTDFYVAFATVCFTLLGLWIIVVQTPPWRVAPQPGPSTAGLWGRVTLLAARIDEPAVAGRSGQHRPVADLLAVVAAGGVLALALVRGPAPTGLGAAAYVTAVVLYVLIALVAVAPGMVAELGVLARPLRVEAVLLTMLVFLGVNVAWLLLFDQAPPPSAVEDPTRPRA
jgi:hypothetical protein